MKRQRICFNFHRSQRSMRNGLKLSHQSTFWKLDYRNKSQIAIHAQKSITAQGNGTFFLNFKKAELSILMFLTSVLTSAKNRLVISCHYVISLFYFPYLLFTLFYYIKPRHNLNFSSYKKKAGLASESIVHINKSIWSLNMAKLKALQQIVFISSITVFPVALIPARNITCPAPRELARLILIWERGWWTSLVKRKNNWIMGEKAK